MTFLNYGSEFYGLTESSLAPRQICRSVDPTRPVRTGREKPMPL